MLRGRVLLIAGASSWCGLTVVPAEYRRSTRLTIDWRVRDYAYCAGVFPVPDHPLPASAFPVLLAFVLAVIAGVLLEPRAGVSSA